jgi:hypothetical protein
MGLLVLTTSNTSSGLRLIAFPARAHGKINEKTKIRIRFLLILGRFGFLKGDRFKASHRKFTNQSWQPLTGARREAPARYDLAIGRGIALRPPGLVAKRQWRLARHGVSGCV